MRRAALAFLRRLLNERRIRHRGRGYRLLQGRGLEVGALDHPARLPRGCEVEYCDALTRAEAVRLFPELDEARLVEVDHRCDLDTQGLSVFADGQFDFVVLNHVVEHVANPIRVVEECFRVTRPGGHVVISAPDKEFTYDRPRALTGFEHLAAEYHAQVTTVSDEHYLDFLRAVHPDKAQLDAAQLAPVLAAVRRRREHAHVWDSASFRAFLERSLALLGVAAACVFERTGAQTRYEYFALWRKT